MVWPGSWGGTMEGPQNVGTPFVYVGDTERLPGSSACLVSWSFWKHFLGTVMKQAVHDLTDLPNL